MQEPGKKLRILVVLYYYHPYVSGLSLLAKAEAEGVAARGHEVTVLTTQYEPGLPASETINGVHVIRAKVIARIDKGVLSWDLLNKLVALAKTHDIVNPHLPMAHCGLATPFIAAGKLVPQYHCDLNLGKGLSARLLQRFAYWSMQRTLNRSERIIATTADYFANSRFAGFAARVCEIYPPIDQRKFGRQDAAALRARLGITGNPYLIGFVGRIVAEKGLNYLLQAIPLLQEKLDDFVVLIAGESARVVGGSVKAQLEAVANQYPDRVRFLGHLSLDDLVAFYNLIDVLVLPSVDPLEAFGMVQVEAMLCGTPVIASDMPGVREVVRQTGFGRLVKPRSPQDIADKVLELANHPVALDREQLAVFDYDHSIDKYEALFAAIADTVAAQFGRG